MIFFLSLEQSLIKFNDIEPQLEISSVKDGLISLKIEKKKKNRVFVEKLRAISYQN